MVLRFEPFTLPVAQAISLWSYPPPYEVYDANGTTEAIEEYLGGSYYVARDEEAEVVGYACYGLAAQVPVEGSRGAYQREDLLDIGLGLRPDLCGRGLGSSFLAAAMEFGRERHSPRGFRLTVAAFNRRAVAVYARAGFTLETSFVRDTAGEKREFQVMILEPS